VYPNGEGKTFDMDYYATKHMPMAASLFGNSLKTMSIDKGVAGRTQIRLFHIWQLDTFTLKPCHLFKTQWDQILPNFERILRTSQIFSPFSS
jgi:hypothetical protein